MVINTYMDENYFINAENPYGTVRFSVLIKTPRALLVFAAFEQNHVLESLFYSPIG